ncbi:MAG: sulfite exporter TauE/SafE family protein [Gammaproteobacteria bacterium]|nr:sulfite exporter TauE/SafE family protein [Gammaproteobacteria bacterium]
MSGLFGLIVGFSLGLTGGGGSIFAVPLLVYGLAVPVHQAVMLSLATVGSMSLVGAISHLRRGAADWKTGFIFGVAGIVGAPLGTWLGAKLSGAWLLTGFALLMLGVATRLWLQASRHPEQTQVVRATPADVAGTGPHCRVDPTGHLRLSSRCLMVLILSGVVTGVLAGLFGVGGGFLIVPALVLIVALPMQRAVATSLLIIAIISVGGVLSHLLAGQSLNGSMVIGFLGGGLLGMALGMALGRRLAGPLLQRLFAVMMVSVAVFMLAHGALHGAA